MNVDMKIGLGSFRFFLASLVAISHLWENMMHGPAAYSVWGFYVLSGFLMTLILTQKYGFSCEGLRKYVFNRFLRIYPSYFVGCIFGIIVLVLVIQSGMDTHALNPAFHYPANFQSALCNVFMLPLRCDGSLVPVAGALWTEFWAYGLMIFSARSRSAAWLGLILTAFANYGYGFDTSTFTMRYSYFAPSIMGFFVGSLCVHYYDLLKKSSMPVISLTSWCLHCVIWLWFPSYPWETGIYVSLLLSAWVVVSLFPVKSNSADKLLGDISYLMYLMHTTIGMCIYRYFGERSIVFFATTYVLTLIVSYIMVKYFERPIQKHFKKKP